jgi:DNA excision repair protein ERCC-2
MRHAAQCLGRVLRGKDDYGIMVLADRRFQKKKDQLPTWISQAMDMVDGNLSTDMAVITAQRFFRNMAQPFRSKDQDGISMWSLEDLRQHQAEKDEERIAELQRDEVIAERLRQAQASQLALEDDDYDMDDDEMREMMEIDGMA